MTMTTYHHRHHHHHQQQQQPNEAHRYSGHNNENGQLYTEA